MRLARYLFGTLTATLIAVGIALPVATHVAPLIGFDVLAVRGRSMEPAVGLGSLILVAHRDPADLEVGDVITWKGQNDVFVTHRVIGIVEGDGGRQFETQGDASSSPDGALISENLVVGSVAVTIPIAGYALLMLSTPSGIVSWLSFGLALLLADGLVAGERTKTGPGPSTRRPGHGLLRLISRRSADVEPQWPVHFTGVTVLGDDPQLIAAMVRCSEGDHRACRVDASPRSGVTGVRDWAKAA